MAAIQIVEVISRRQRKAFVLFPLHLYADNPYYVPPLIVDELETLDSKKNSAFAHADAKLFLAMRDSEIVGRLAVIVNDLANQIEGGKNLRFGWFDCVEDYAVAEALFRAGEAWGREKGMLTVSGPQGFMGLDKEGMLIEGFDCTPTFGTYYNFPYYNDFVTRYGFEKLVDTFEFVTHNAGKKPLPKKIATLVEWVKKRGNFHVLEFKNKKEMLSRTNECFKLLDETYTDILGYVPLSQEQRDHMIKQFALLLNLDTIKMVVNRHDEMVGFLIAIPSLSRALQKSKGRLLPFGWYHLWKATRTYQTLDFVLAGVHKGYRGRGIDMIMAHEIHKTVAKLGFEYTESNPELETNQRVQSEWKHFNPILRRKHRIYRKDIQPVPNAF
jgi:hypothetical protein